MAIVRIPSLLLFAYDVNTFFAMTTSYYQPCSSDESTGDFSTVGNKNRVEMLHSGWLTYSEIIVRIVDSAGKYSL